MLVVSMAKQAAARAVWADVPAEERTRRMREVVRKRWAKAKRAK